MRRNGEVTSPSFLVLIAALNEEQGIGPTLRELGCYLEDPWVLVVDGASRDRTIEIAKNFDADILFQSGKGKGDAIACAVQSVNFNGEYVIMTDADYTYPATFIPKMMRVLDENPQVGMVCGNRFNRDFDNTGMANMFYAGNQFLAATHNFFNGVRLADPLTGLRVIRWSILKGWKPKSTGFDIEVELNHLVERKGYGIVEIPISYRDRLGEKKLKARHGLEIFKRILLEGTY